MCSPDRMELCLLGDRMYQLFCEHSHNSSKVNTVLIDVDFDLTTFQTFDGLKKLAARGQTAVAARLL